MQSWIVNERDKKESFRVCYELFQDHILKGWNWLKKA